MLHLGSALKKGIKTDHEARDNDKRAKTVSKRIQKVISIDFKMLAQCMILFISVMSHNYFIQSDTS